MAAGSSRRQLMVNLIEGKLMAAGSSRRQFLYFILICFVITVASGLVPATPLPNLDVIPYCLKTGNYTSNSTYKANLETLLSSISSDTQIDYGFYNLSFGDRPDQANAIALCRGDVKPNICLTCLNNTNHKLLQGCPNQKEAMGISEYCMVRYSNKSIFGVNDFENQIVIRSNRNVSDEYQFNETLKGLLENLSREAASGNSYRKFATGEASALNVPMIYALVQCTPDLVEQDCNHCLDVIMQSLPSCCDGTDGARIFAGSCNFRYEISSFYDMPLSPLVPPTPTPSKGKKSSDTVKIIIIVILTTVPVVILLITISIFLRRRRQEYAKPMEITELADKINNMDEVSSVESLQFDFGTIRAATNDFSNDNKLGQGGFGAVYMGKLSNGKNIAVKRLSKNSKQGAIEFQNEVLLVAKLQHRNLVRLLGFCLEGDERLLIYEFVPNGSLDHFIFVLLKRTQLDWERRYKIILGIARGLLYLHEDSRLRIIHRDLKASNVLLDMDMDPKISDFGLARLFATDETQGRTNRIVGTYGYMAPEYAMHGQFSIKSDVFSFGVLILEIISGQKNNCFRNDENVEDLLSFAWGNWRAGTASNLIDPTLSTGSRTEMMRCIHIGLLCVQENVADRPTMGSVVHMLDNHSLILPGPSKPAFFINRNIDESRISANIMSLQCSINEASITELYPR